MIQPSLGTALFLLLWYYCQLSSVKHWGGMKDLSQYFGIPEENIEAAEQRRKISRHPMNAEVPTRKQIATLPAAELRAKLIGWMEHSATEIIPSRAQIAMVKEVLSARPDAAHLAPIINMCTHFIEGA
jgi:hypothetical protein